MKKDETARFVVGYNATAEFSMLGCAGTFSGVDLWVQICVTMMGSPALRPST